MADEEGQGERRAKHAERPNLCLPDFENEAIVHEGDEGFQPALKQYYEWTESNAAERLIELKNRLRVASTHDFWGILMEEMCDMANAQCGFVAKRLLVDDENTAVEMPKLGEPGSCLLGVAFYLTDGRDDKNMYRDYRYHAYGSPCAHMRHDKVLLIPERLAEFTPNNPNKFPWERSEAFIGVPLFSEGKCFAHFGMMWSSKGAPKRHLSWGMIEVLMHGLEDMITQRLVEGRGFAKSPANDVKPARIIPLDAITASQSLKPYARSLSHELRTPMQGVIGMLDIMHSTVIDAMDTQMNEAVRATFEELKSNIEMVQDSSKRAVDAADNVVHAYDLNMQMPDTPLTNDEESTDEESMAPLTEDSQCPINVIEGAGISMSQSKEKRPRSEELDFHPGPPLKRLAAVTKKGLRQEYGNGGESSTSMNVLEKPLVSSKDFAVFADSQMPANDVFGPPLTDHNAGGGPTSPTISTILNPGHRCINTREFMHGLVNEAVRSVHPFQKVNTVTELGEMIEVQTEGPRGEKTNITVHLIIELDIPENIVAEEQHLHFVLQKVVDNAIKFTEKGSIVVSVKMARNAQLLEIRVIDTGCGVTEESKAYLFKPHFQEDATISRSRDGLGLSLFNAKAHVRKNLGGDMTLERSATHGPLKGSEFLIRLPLSPLPDVSRPHTPLLGFAVPGATPRSSRHSSPRPPASSRGSSNTSGPTSAPTSVPSSESIPRRISNAGPTELIPRRIGSAGPTELIPRRPSYPAVVEQTPAGPSDSAATRPTTIQTKPTFNRNLAQEVPLTFLVAEDNVINRNVLVGYLKKLGYSSEDIILAFDGAEAVQQYQASLSRPPGKRIDAVLMDLWMPNMDGYQATEHILNMARRRGETLAVMAVTADITSESLDRAKQTGMKGYMSKPYKVLDVQHLILEHFKNNLQAV